MTELEKLEALLRHKENVRENCHIMGKKFMEQGQAQLGLALIANGHIHDNSKFAGIEWDFTVDPKVTNRVGLKQAVSHHHRTNPHHPEYWPGGINAMPDLYLAEMVCDWKARSNEFAECLRDWINTKAIKQYQFTKDSEVYKKIMICVDMICEKPFLPIEEEIPVPVQPVALVPA